MTEPLRVLDLFSGIGGFSLGLERTGGFKTVAFCEIEPFCRRVLAKHWPDVPAHDDVTTREFKEGEADVIVGGFPCQDLSYAGGGAGLAGARSGLYRELVRAICVVRPRLAILENVAALLGRGLGTVLGDLAESGYDAAWDCLPASSVGAPHQRDRIWIVAHPGGEQHEGAGDAIWGKVSEGLPEAFERNTGLPVGSGAESDAQRSDADGTRPYRAQVHQLRDAELRDEQDGLFGPLGVEVADANRKGLEIGQEHEVGPGAVWLQGDAAPSRGWWSTEPDVGRVAHGVPARVDRLRSLGNAVVPQVVELIGRAILATKEGIAA